MDETKGLGFTNTLTRRYFCSQILIRSCAIRSSLLKPIRIWFCNNSPTDLTLRLPKWSISSSNVGAMRKFISSLTICKMSLDVRMCILFWTWVLNIICKAGYKWVSWLLVLLPFILIFFMMWVVSNSH